MFKKVSSDKDLFKSKSNYESPYFEFVIIERGIMFWFGFVVSERSYSRTFYKFYKDCLRFSKKKKKGDGHSPFKTGHCDSFINRTSNNDPTYNSVYIVLGIPKYTLKTDFLLK